VERILKSPERQNSPKKDEQPQKALIAVRSFLGFLALLYLGFYMFNRFYFFDNYMPIINAEGDIEFVKNGVLLWGHIDNRQFLRCIHGYGLCLCKLEHFEEA